MHLNCLEKSAAVLKSSFLTLTCLVLAMSLALSGCSKAEKKEQPKKEKPVVTDLNIKPDAKTPDQAEAPKKDEVESLPMESDEEEEQLPVLGAGG